MLSQAPVYATLPFRGLKAAPAFYAKKLGLKLVSGSVKEGYLEYGGGKGTLIQLFESTSTKKSNNTAATFLVKDLAREMAALRKKRVVFEEYDLPGIKTVRGVATMGDTQGAWVKDPAGNILALIEAG